MGFTSNLNNFPPGVTGREPEIAGMSDNSPIHCTRCHWSGTYIQLVPVYQHNSSDPGDVTPEPSCPVCLDGRWLEEGAGK